MSKKRRGFLLGVVVGAAAGLLLAPKRGKELRGQLAGGKLDLSAQKDRLQAMMGGGSADERSEELKRKIEETRQRLREQMGAPAPE